MNLFNSANKALTTCLAGPSSFSARQYGSSATRAASSLAGKSTAVPGYGHFTSPLRKVHLDYHCDSVAQRGLRLVQDVKRDYRRLLKFVLSSLRLMQSLHPGRSRRGSKGKSRRRIRRSTAQAGKGRSPSRTLRFVLLVLHVT